MKNQNLQDFDNHRIGNLSDHFVSISLYFMRENGGGALSGRTLRSPKSTAVKEW